MPTVIITPVKWARSPLLVFFLALIGLSGVLIATGLQRTPIVKGMGEPWATIWGVGLSLGSFTTVAGSYWRNQIDGLLIERSGVFLLSGTAAIYSVLILVFAGFSAGFTSSLVYAIFAVACYRQVRYINIHMGLIINALERLAEEDDGEH